MSLSHVSRLEMDWNSLSNDDKNLYSYTKNIGYQEIFDTLDEGRLILHLLTPKLLTFIIILQILQL